MRRTISTPPPDLKKPELNTWEIQLKTITPMFGGSATPREVDSTNPIRASSVRGHLRFWWRATAGAQYAKPEELFEAEEKIWGSAEKHGEVALRVTVIRAGDKKPAAKYLTGKSFPDFGSYPGYALFPFQGKANRSGVTEQPAEGINGIEFMVNLIFPVGMKPEVEASISAWVMFGGIGARTRRGCGSLELVSQNPATTKTYRLNQTPLTLAPLGYLVGDKLSDPIAGWKKAIETYKDFRQGVPYARSEGQEHSRPGRSKWPEPDTIRRLSGRNSSSHKPIHSVSGFPKADLGLPIIFHFKDEREGDPTDHTLESASKFGTRFASPVITKAIKVDGGYAPAIILLDAPHVWEVGDLEFKKQGKTIPKSQVELTPEQRQQVPPLNGLPIREALVEFAKSKGFKEVKL